jgi:hypothetical protein
MFCSRERAFVSRTGAFAARGRLPLRRRPRPILPEAEVSERRAGNRYWVNLDATASVGGLVLSQRCRVCDASLGGLGILLGGISLIPLEFDITIDGNLVPVPCRLVWRWVDFAGLSFLQSAPPLASTREE